MIEDTNNKKLQKAFFLVSLMVVIFGIITMITTGYAEVLKFKYMDTSASPIKTSQQPFFIIWIFAVVALFFSGRNLKRLRDKEKE